MLPSVVGVDRFEGNTRYAGKRLQEALLSSGPVPFTIQRATQSHEFAGQVVGWTRVGQVAPVPPLPVQPVAAGAPRGRATDLAGPEARLAPTTFDAWRAGQSVTAPPGS